MIVMAPSAVDRDDAPPLEIAALLATIDAYRRDNERLHAKIAELEREEPSDPDLRPLKMLCETPAEYEKARRDRRSTRLLRVVRLSGRLFSKPIWIEEWKRRTGRLR
jgi:hypothetical protein